MICYKRIFYSLLLPLCLLFFFNGKVVAEEWVIDQTVSAPLELVTVDFAEECEGVTFISLVTRPEGEALALRAAEGNSRESCNYWWILDTGTNTVGTNAPFIGSTVVGNSIMFSTTTNPTEAFYCANGIPSGNVREVCPGFPVNITQQSLDAINDPENQLSSDTSQEPEEAFVPPPPSCEAESDGLFTYAFCGIAEFIDRVLVGDDGAGGMAGIIDQLLSIDSQQYSDTDLKQSWTYFRNIASLALVLIGLIMVIGQAISKE